MSGDNIMDGHFSKQHSDLKPILEYKNIEFENTCAIVNMDYTVTIIGIASQVVNDTAICPGDTALLWATNATEYSWTPTETLSHPDSSTTLAYPTEPTLYNVNVLNTLGCSLKYV